MPSPSLVIFNSKPKGKSVKMAVERLRLSGLAPVVAFPDKAAGVDGLIRAMAPQVDRVIIAGGDGTLNHAAAALYATGLPLGILPGGTANDLAHTLGIPGSWQAALDLILAGGTVAVDLGFVGGRPFFNAAQIGVGAAVRRRLTKRRKRLLGVFGYAWAAWDGLRRARPFTAEIAHDGRVYRRRVIHITVGNGRFYGGGMPITRTASIGDDRLDLFAIDPASTRRLARLALSLRRGRVGDNPHLWLTSARHIRVATDPAVPVTADGERVCMTPAEFSVTAGAINIYASDAVAPENAGESESVLRDEWETALEDVLVHCHEQADLYADTAAHLDDAAAAEHCRQLEKDRRRMAETVAALLREHGVLPRVPDPERETAEKWLDNVRAAFSGHETESLLHARMHGDDDLHALIERALARDDLPAEMRAVLAPYAERIVAQRRDLAALLETRQE